MSEAIQIEARSAGIYLPELDLWLDPRGKQKLAFISHAHADHFSRAEQSFCSPQTAHLLHRRFGLKLETLIPIPHSESKLLKDHELTLLPAGHVVGSSMLHILRKSDGQSLLYTGDFKTVSSRTCETAIAKQANTLIMETTYGRPHYLFPERTKVEASIIRFLKEAFDNEEIPILCAYALGKAQELTALLAAHDIPILAHPSVMEMNEACREIGLGLPELTKLESPIPPRHAVICPPNAARSQAIRRLKNKQLAMVSGWGLQPNARYRYQVDEVFPLSDHADYRELLDFVDAINPDTVYTVHGSTREFAADLRSRGRRAWSLFSADQLEFLERPGTSPAVKSTESIADTFDDRPLSLLNDLLNKVALTASRKEKCQLLADYFSTLPENELEIIVSWISEHSLQLGFGFASMRLALLQAFGVSLSQYRAISDQQQDASRTARILSEAYLNEHQHKEFPIFTHREVSLLLDDLRNTTTQLDAIQQLAETLQQIPPPEVELLLRILTREFRIGGKEGILEQSLALAFSSEDSAFAKAHMLTGDLARTALLAKQHKLSQAKLTIGKPVKVMLATPAPDADTIWQKLTRVSKSVWLEDKYDGIRAQLHKKDDLVVLFSRDGRSLNDEFPELVQAASTLPDSILDGEIIAYEEGRKLTFFDLQKRLGKKNKNRGQGSLFAQDEIPVRFIVFDLLSHFRKSLWEAPLAMRRATLETIPFAPPFEILDVHRAKSSEEIDQVFKSSRARRNEGLIAKDPDSPYQFGRRGQAWLKLKKAEVTLDCVVTRAQQGHGKRAGVLSDYTFAVRDESNGALRIIGKAYSGLTDTEIETLTEHFIKTTIEKKRRVHEVDPQIVLEIAFDSIRPSKRHDSGLAMRFPRIKAIRRDKSPEEIDTLQFARTLVS